MGKFGLYCPSICGRVQQLTLSPQQPPEEEASTVEAVYPWVADILDDRPKGHTGPTGQIVLLCVVSGIG